MDDTRDEQYAVRLATRGQARWKRLLHAQAPYQFNLRRQRLGRTLDVGCGTGRNLVTLDEDSVGVDHNPRSVEFARHAGFTALTTEEWQAHPLNEAEAFDGLLFAHVIEHMDPDAGLRLVREYIPALRTGGKAFFICPQERGYASDQTHVRWTRGQDLQQLAKDAGLVPERWRSFPLPRAAGRVFTYNEFTLLAHKPRHPSSAQDV